MPLTEFQKSIAQLLAQNRSEDSHLAGGAALHFRCEVVKGNEQTKIEWARDSSWRFMPVQKDAELGYVLHPIDLSINKILALAGRDEPRDFLDVMYCHQHILSLGALCWAACGKDPGFNPTSLLELLKRRSKFQREDFARLQLAIEIDLIEMKQNWLNAVATAERFFQIPPPQDVGCLYYSQSKAVFVQPNQWPQKDITTHFGSPGGVLPRLLPS